MSKLISTFKIGFDDETKAEIAALKSSLDAITGTLGLPSALLGSTKPNGGLLDAMGEAANDAPEFAPEFLELGQWVFEGQDEKWHSAAVNSDGRAYLHNMPKKKMFFNHDSYGWCAKRFDRHEMKLIDGLFNPSGFTCLFIERETVNDVDYLSETVPEIQGMEASEIIIDELGRDYSPNSNCLHAVVPQITQADMQLIFIKNLSECLIQRMHSMDRFSEDDYHIGGDKLMPWDIVFDQVSQLFGVVVNDKDNILSAFFLKAHCEKTGGGCAHNFHTNSLMSRANRTITEAELPAFRTALEAYHA